MRRINKMTAIVLLAVVATLGTQTAFANTGVLLGDRHATPSVKPVGLVGFLLVFVKTGVVLDARDGVLVGD